MTSAAEPEIVVHDSRSLTDEQLAAGHELSRVLQLERDPQAPAVSLERAIASHRAMPDFAQGRTVYAKVQGRLVASAGAGWYDLPENAHLAECGVGVHPEHRRAGLGRQLAAELLREVEAAGRRVVIFSTDERVPAGAEFAHWLGAQEGSKAHTNRLLLESVDRTLLQRWVDEAEHTAGAYELVDVPWPYPEEWLAPLADLFHVMNDAPHDDLDVEPMRIDAELVRQQVAQAMATGQQEWPLVARHRTSGELAGMHTLAFSPDDPATAYVGVTMVRPEHRGHGIGRWLKAVATLRVLAERPEVNDIRTGNADSNAAMLRINEEMGYRPYVANTLWQVDVADAQRRLNQLAG